MDLLSNANKVILSQTKDEALRKASAERKVRTSNYEGQFWSDEVRRQVRSHRPFADAGINVFPAKIYPYLYKRVDGEILRKLEDSVVVSIETTTNPLRTSVLHANGLEVVVYHKPNLMKFYIFDEQENILFHRILNV